MTAPAAYEAEVRACQQAAALYREQAAQVGPLLQATVDGLTQAVDGITALVAALDTGYQGLTEAADRIDQAAGNLDLPQVERAPDRIADAVSSMPPALRRLFYAARGGREQLLAALADAVTVGG